MLYFRPALRRVAWPILDVRHFSDINRALLLKAGAALNLVRGTAERLLENLRSRIATEAEALYIEVEAEKARISNGRENLSATMAGELRCLRTVLHAVIKEMTEKIA
jgi:serine/threonine-protein kinase HipA